MRGLVGRRGGGWLRAGGMSVWRARIESGGRTEQRPIALPADPKSRTAMLPGSPSAPLLGGPAGRQSVDRRTNIG